MSLYRHGFVLCTALILFVKWHEHNQKVCCSYSQKFSVGEHVPTWSKCGGEGYGSSSSWCCCRVVVTCNLLIVWMHILVGSPIKVDRCEHPDESLVDALHQRYMDELSCLFNKYKQQFGVDSSQTLNFYWARVFVIASVFAILCILHNSCFHTPTHQFNVHFRWTQVNRFPS